MFGHSHVQTNHFAHDHYHSPLSTLAYFQGRQHRHWKRAAIYVISTYQVRTIYWFHGIWMASGKTWLILVSRPWHSDNERRKDYNSHVDKMISTILNRSTSSFVFGFLLFERISTLGYLGFPNWGFLKWGYPQSSSIRFWIFHELKPSNFYGIAIEAPKSSPYGSGSKFSDDPIFGRITIH